MPMDNEALYKEVLAYLANHQVMTLATVGVEGVWATAVFYVNVQLNLIFLSAGHTRHAQNMQHTPHISAAIHEDYDDWQGIQGIQLEGDVRQLRGVEKETAVVRYQKKYPFVAKANPQLSSALEKVNWYQLTPTRLYFINNKKGLGYRDQLDLTQGVS